MALVKSCRDSAPSPSLSNRAKALATKGLLLSSSTEARAPMSTPLPSLEILENLRQRAHLADAAGPPASLACSGCRGADLRCSRSVSFFVRPTWYTLLEPAAPMCWPGTCPCPGQA